MRKPRSDAVRTFYVVVGKKIAEARRQQKVTQDGLAAAVSLTRTSIVNIEHGRQQLLLHTWIQIARALKVDLASLTPEVVPMETPVKEAISQFVSDHGGRAWIESQLKKLDARSNEPMDSPHGD